ncbi:MAG: ATP-binding protein [Deltaproteobacteria bacterium]|nr:ATP-binding protein [Deltaproteobacteria bacterium]
MFTRLLEPPPRSFLLLGPRGTGKTTWLRDRLPRARWFDLLLDREQLRLMREPDAFRHEVEALPSGSWIVVDEVQRLPSLLNDVHDLLSRAPRRWRFALTGSSARKLRSADVNLLAGRVVMRAFFALTASELGASYRVEEVLKYGGLPLVASERSREGRSDLLEAYVETYLAQEIRAEALVRRLDSFVRFLEIAALANAQVTNVAAIARDAAIARPTVQGHFDLLVDTLIGAWLPAWRPRAKVKEVAHPKFYFFDPGVVRALARRLREPLESEERGRLLETHVFHELRAHVAYSRCGGRLSYWRTPSGSEVDFLWSRANRAVGIEVKATARWRSEDGRALKELHRSGTIQECFVAYLGDRELRDGEIRVLPVATFLGELAAGRVLLPGRP